MRRRGRSLLILLAMALLLLGIQVHAAGLKITAPKRYVGYQEKLQLTLEGAGTSPVTWISGDTNKVVVDENGVVSGVGAGYVKVIAKTIHGKSAIKLYASRMEIYPFPKSVRIYYDGLKYRTYPLYSQGEHNLRNHYGRNRGCAITTTAIVMNALANKRITPETVHMGKGRYSETYAIASLGSRYKLYDKVTAEQRIKRLDRSTPTNRMLAAILRRGGLKTKYVYRITSNSSKEIYAHLAKGNPVIFTTKSTLKHKGISLAGTWHTLAMIGLDGDGKAIVVNPAGGLVNYSHVQQKEFHFSVAEIVKYYLRSCINKTGLYDGGRYGYILVYPRQ